MTFQEYAEQLARQQIQEIENSDPKKVAFRHLASIDNSLKRIADALEAANSSNSGKANDHAVKIEISPGVLLPITDRCPVGKKSMVGREHFMDGKCTAYCYATKPPRYDHCIFAPPVKPAILSK